MSLNAGIYRSRSSLTHRTLSAKRKRGRNLPTSLALRVSVVSGRERYINNKTTAVRLIPVPGAKAGDTVDFDGLFGSSPILEVRNPRVSDDFVHFGGRIPAPLQSLGN